MSLKACVVCGKKSPSSRCRKHALKSRPRGNAFEPIRQQVIARHGMVCHICREPIKSQADLHIDHIVPRSRGGSDSIENLAPAHDGCNLRKGATGP